MSPNCVAESAKWLLNTGEKIPRRLSLEPSPTISTTKAAKVRRVCFIPYPFRASGFFARFHQEQHGHGLPVRHLPQRDLLVEILCLPAHGGP